MRRLFQGGEAGGAGRRAGGPSGPRCEGTSRPRPGRCSDAGCLLPSHVRLGSEVTAPPRRGRPQRSSALRVPHKAADTGGEEEACWNRERWAAEVRRHEPPDPGGGRGRSCARHPYRRRADRIDRGRRSAPSGRGRRRPRDRRARAARLPRAAERAHARRDDALPRLRGRPPAHGMAAHAHMAGRGAPHRGGRVRRHAPRAGRDDPLRHRLVQRHVLAPGRRGARRRGARPPGARRVGVHRPRGPVRRTGRRDARHRPAPGGGAGGAGTAPSPRARPSRHLHGGAREPVVDRRSGRRARPRAAHPPVGDARRGRGVRGGARRSPGVLPRPARAARSEPGGGARRLPRRRRDGVARPTRARPS